MIKQYPVFCCEYGYAPSEHPLAFLYSSWPEHLRLKMQGGTGQSTALLKHVSIIIPTEQAASIHVCGQKSALAFQGAFWCQTRHVGRRHDMIEVCPQVGDLCVYVDLVLPLKLRPHASELITEPSHISYSHEQVFELQVLTCDSVQ